MTLQLVNQRVETKPLSVQIELSRLAMERGEGSKSPDPKSQAATCQRKRTRKTEKILASSCFLARIKEIAFGEGASH